MATKKSATPKVNRITKEESAAALAVQSPAAPAKNADKISVSMSGFKIGGQTVKALTLNRYVDGAMQWLPLEAVGGVPCFITSAWTNHETGKCFFKCFFIEDIHFENRVIESGNAVHVSTPHNETREAYADHIGKNADNSKPFGPLVFEPIVNSKNGRTFYDLTLVGEIKPNPLDSDERPF